MTGGPVTSWLPLSPPPKAMTTVELQLPGNRVTLGWVGASDSWFTWGGDAKRATNHHSRWQNAGVAPVKPLAWRPYVQTVVVVDSSELISLREVDVIVRRAILTDGTLRRVKQGDIRSSWDSRLHIESSNVGDYVGRDYETPMPPWRPEPFDIDNYLPGMGWFTSLGKPGQTEITREQEMIVLRAYGLSYETVGERFGVSKQRCRDVYWRGIERIWARAKSEADSIRRLPRSLWARDHQFSA